MQWENILALFGTFFVLTFLSVPVSFAIGLATLTTVLLFLPFDNAVFVIAQKMITSLDNFTLLALPFFILAGNIMNHGGIAIRLINLAQIMIGRLPGALMHCNIVANMLFGAISGSAVAAAAAVGGTILPTQRKAGYDPAFATAVNIASCPIGLIIPPSNALIVYSLISGGTSIAALFVAGYLPGLLMGATLIAMTAAIARKRNYLPSRRPAVKDIVKIVIQAILPLSLIVIVIGGIVNGVFTATEASAIAVVYALVLALIVYREITIRQLPKIFLDSMVTTAIVLLLIGCSVGMSWAMAYADIPYTISDALFSLSSNRIVILLMINLVLLIVGLFMDMTPALLIFTPIFLPVATHMGMDPVQFGIMIVLNLCLGICTPPVGSALFVGCSIANVRLGKIIPYMLPLYCALALALLLVIFIPELSLILPKLFLGYGK